MKLFPDLSTFIIIGPIAIKWYAVLILVGAFSAYLISLRNIKKMGYPGELVDDFFFGALLSGVVGSRIWYVLFFDLNYFIANPLQIFATWQGGLAIQGGLVAGVIFAVWFTHRHKLNFFRFADAIVPNILIAQAIGRWGNFLNQEAYGSIVNESYYKYFPSFIKNTMYIESAYRVPTFLYESVLNVLGFFLIVIALKRFSKPKRGDLAYAYLMWYGITRFWVEGMRTDSLMFMGLRMAQVTSVVFVLIGMVGMLGLFRKLFKGKKPVILFDLDGTLLDTEKAIIATYKQLISEKRTDYEFTKEDELSVLGPTLKEMMPKLIPGEDPDLMIQRYREINNDLHATHVVPVEGAKELITELKKQGYQLGIVSSKLTETVQLGLSLFDMQDDFKVIVGYEDVSKHKPDPEGIFKACQLLGRGHDDVLYVGDSDTDILVAQNAAVYSVGLILNQDRKDSLVKSAPNVTINSLSELLDVLKEDISWTKSTT